MPLLPAEVLAIIDCIKTHWKIRKIVVDQTLVSACCPRQNEHTDIKKVANSHVLRPTILKRYQNTLKIVVFLFLPLFLLRCTFCFHAVSEELLYRWVNMLKSPWLSDVPLVISLSLLNSHLFGGSNNPKNLNFGYPVYSFKPNWRQIKLVMMLKWQIKSHKVWQVNTVFVSSPRFMLVWEVGRATTINVYIYNYLISGWRFGMLV